MPTRRGLPGSNLRHQRPKEQQAIPYAFTIPISTAAEPTITPSSASPSGQLNGLNDLTRSSLE
eukprot:scaffold172057_cov41-Prasinocladus_malaysianus.AAC.1